MISNKISINDFDVFKYNFILYLQEKGYIIDNPDNLTLNDITSNENYHQRLNRFIKKYNKNKLDDKYYHSNAIINTDKDKDNILHKKNKSNHSIDINNIAKEKKQKIKHDRTSNVNDTIADNNNNNHNNNDERMLMKQKTIKINKINNISLMQDILVTESSFDRIRLRNAMYIDKTKQIYNNLLKSDKYYMLVRPRRFGKSLLCSTISNLFGGNSTKDLFKGLWIYDNKEWDFEKEKHPVIHLDMSSVAGANSNVNKLEEKVKMKLINVALKNELELAQNIETKTIESIFVTLILTLKQKYNNKDVVIIIDEYDKPLLDLIDNPEEMEAVRKSLQTFYSILKSEESNLRLVFITGLYKFSEMNMFSTLNNLNDISMDLQAGKLCGYTENEIRKYFHRHMQTYILKAHLADDNILIDQLKDKYNGYRFGLDDITEEISKSVYNPFAINYVFSKQSNNIDYWYLSGSAQLIAKKIFKKGFNIADKGISITLNELQSPAQLSGINLYTLMYYGGYLTIDKYDKKENKLILKIPNSSINELLKNDIFKYIFSLEENIKGTQIEDLVDDIYNFLSRTPLDLFKDEIPELIKKYNLLFYGFPYSLLKTEEGFRNIVDFTLKYKFNDILFEGAVSMGTFDTVIKTDDRIYLFEYKCNSNPQVAFNQIIDKGYYQSLVIYKLPILLFGVNFKKKKKKNKEEKKEKDTDYYNNISNIEFEIIYPQ